MIKSLKKMIVFGTAIAMSAGMLAGCGSSKGGDSASVELNDAGTYPIVKDGTIDMTMFTMSMPNVEDFATNDFTKYMEEKTGIHMLSLIHIWRNALPGSAGICGRGRRRKSGGKAYGGKLQGCHRHRCVYLLSLIHI